MRGLNHYEQLVIDNIVGLVVRIMIGMTVVVGSILLSISIMNSCNCFEYQYLYTLITNIINAKVFVTLSPPRMSSHGSLNLRRFKVKKKISDFFIYKYLYTWHSLLNVISDLSIVMMTLYLLIRNTDLKI